MPRAGLQSSVVNMAPDFVSISVVPVSVPAHQVTSHKIQTEWILDAHCLSVFRLLTITTKRHDQCGLCITVSIMDVRSGFYVYHLG